MLPRDRRTTAGVQPRATAEDAGSFMRPKGAHQALLWETISAPSEHPLPTADQASLPPCVLGLEQGRWSSQGIRLAPC